MNRNHTLAVLTIICGLVAGCSEPEPDRKSGETVYRDGEPPVSYVSDDDPQMDAAIQKARDTADQFIAALNNPQPTQNSFTVKMPVSDGRTTEHMWISPVRFENGKFMGTLNNEPEQVQNVKLGDQMEVPKNEISDWMYIDNDVLVGGYTLRALRDRMSPQERAEFDNTIPFRVE